MEETNNNSPAEEPAVEELKPEEAQVEELGQAPEIDKPKPKDRKKILIPIIAVCLVLVIGIAIWYLTKPKDGQSNSQNPETSQTDKKDSKEKDSKSSEIESEDKKTEPTGTETAIEVDESGLSPLFRKVLILHHPNLKNYLSYAGSSSYAYEENQRFSFGSNYAVSDSLYTSGLSNSDKIFIVTQYMAGYDLLKPLSNYGVPENYIVAKAEYCQRGNNSSGPGCTIDSVTAASEEEVAEVYYELFGETPTTFENPTRICGARIHDPEYHLYYSQMPGCGGGDGPIHEAYVEKYTEDDSSTYVYVRIATINVYESDNVPVYKTFFGLDDLYDSNTNQAVKKDESLVYSRLGSGGMGMTIPTIITAENYTEFQQYRFVFKKDGENYYFRTLEKL